MNYQATSHKQEFNKTGINAQNANPGKKSAFSSYMYPLNSQKLNVDFMHQDLENNEIGNSFNLPNLDLDDDTFPPSQIGSIEKQLQVP